MPKLSFLKSFDLLLVPPTGLTPLERGQGSPMDAVKGGGPPRARALRRRVESGCREEGRLSSSGGTASLGGEHEG